MYGICRLAFAALLSVTIARVGAAQALSPVALPRYSVPAAKRAEVSEVAAEDDLRLRVAHVTASQVDVPPRTLASPWWAPVVSLVVPGSGQFALGQQRSVAYVVAEAYLVVQGLSARRDGDRDRSDYRALATDVARRAFGTVRPVGPWSYYETMERYLESGSFDRIAGGGVDPEIDESTYNGASWRLARETFWRNPSVPPALGSPEYQRALDFYARRAVRDEYRWSWRDAQLQQDVYRQTIMSANRSYKRFSNMFGVVGANHLASMIDAYVTVRVRRYGGVRVAGVSLDGLETDVRSLGDPAAGARQMSAGLRFVPSAR